jgi:NAD+--dinitrogen-reductase ADP-D-ribosyltransferase
MPSTQPDLSMNIPSSNWRKVSGECHLTLYRASSTRMSMNFESPANERIVRLNNLSSFTSRRRTGWEFGYTVWEVKVPICKIFFNELLPNSILGEGELIVFGANIVQIIPCTILKFVTKYHK